MYSNDKRIVVTLDAGGTNFVFGAIRGYRQVVAPVRYPSNSHDLDLCLATLKKGFSEVIAALPEPPVAISFAFPGPADYARGVICGNLPNFPSFRKGVALGPFLEREFGLPVFINNDGNLYAYGEAVAGALAQVNARLEAAGSTQRYRNLVGITFGTGFGCGVVIDGKLLLGDNGADGDVWCFRNCKYPELIIEESVSIRAVIRVYREQSGDERDLSPKDIFDIADGRMPGNAEAAKKSFGELGAVAGDALVTVSTVADGLVVIGGGLTGAAKYFMPALIAAMRTPLAMSDGTSFPRMQSEVYNLCEEEEFQRFAADTSIEIPVYGSEEKVRCQFVKKTGVLLTSIGASEAISLGAYAYALQALG